MSLVGALGPLGKVAGGKRSWLEIVAIYTLAGAATSALVGTALGTLGRLLPHEQFAFAGIVVAVAVAAVAASHELGWISLRLPEPRRQTKEFWGRTFSRPVAAMLWGLDLGMVFTTWFTFSGTWLLIVAAIASGNSTSGAALFVAHWLGRAASVWLAPILMDAANATPRLLDAIAGEYRTLQLSHVAGLAFAITILISLLANGGRV